MYPCSARLPQARQSGSPAQPTSPPISLVDSISASTWTSMLMLSIPARGLSGGWSPDLLIAQSRDDK
jgi:hypothetical protein